MPPRAAPGAVVAWWDGSALTFGTIAGEEKQRLRLVLSGGREERLLPSRIAFEIEPATASGHDRVTPAHRAGAAASRVESQAGTVDVPLLWEIAHEGGGEVDLASLASLALGGSDGLSRAAVAVAFLREGVRFFRRGDSWGLRDAAGVAEIERQRSREAERATERQRFLQALSSTASGGIWEPAGTDAERRGLRALEDLAVLDQSASESVRDVAVAILDELRVPGDRPAERAFRLLRKVGVFGSDDENLPARRLGLRAGFPEEVLEHASAAARRGWSREGRADLTGLEVITVDAPTTRDIDDGLSIEPVGARWRVAIHIADPTAFIQPGDPVDAEALTRATAHYMPDLRVPMLPAVLSEQAASLIAGEERPAVSFLLEVGADGEWTDLQILKSFIRCRGRVSYDEADEAIRSGGGRHASLLSALHDLSLQLERRRALRGAVILKGEEVDVRVEDDGRIVLDRLDAFSPSRRLVSEAMVLAGEAAARFCIDRKIPSLFRRQPPPAGPVVVVPPGAEGDPVLVRAVRRTLRRGEVTVLPGPHHALGLSAYSQATSPLRRYQDLTVHRQIGAALAGVAPPYGPEELQKLAATTERAEIAARDAERSCERYWLLRALETSPSRTVDAVVVDVDPTIVQLCETLLEERVPSLLGVSPGDRIVLTVERVNPRAEFLALRPA